MVTFLVQAAAEPLVPLKAFDSSAFPWFMRPGPLFVVAILFLGTVIILKAIFGRR